MSAAGDFIFRLGVKCFAFVPICGDRVLRGLIFSGMAIFAGRETVAFGAGVAGTSDGPIVSIADRAAGEAANPELVVSLGGASGVCISDEFKDAVLATDSLAGSAGFPLIVGSCKPP